MYGVHSTALTAMEGSVPGMPKHNEHLHSPAVLSAIINPELELLLPLFLLLWFLDGSAASLARRELVIGWAGKYSPSSPSANRTGVLAL